MKNVPVTLADVKAVTEKTFDMPQGESSLQYYYDRMLQCVNPDSSPDQVLEFMSQVDGFVQAAKMLQSEMKTAVIEWIQENGDITLDKNTRFYVGNAKETKCLDMNAVGMALLDLCDGDLGRVFKFIKAQGWKHGSVKKIISPEVYDTLYTTTEREILKEGKPQPLKLLKKTTPFTSPGTYTKEHSND